MKKAKYILIISALLLLFSCEEYLDVEKESIDLTEEEIFGNFFEFRDYISSMYEELNVMWMASSYGARNGGEKFAGFPICASDQVRSYDNYLFEDRWFNVGEFSTFYCEKEDHHHLKIWNRAWAAIRVANVTIQKIDMLQDATIEQKNGLLGQAYMGRAFAYEYMLEIWGGMHYLKKPINDNNFDFKRLTYYETALNIAQDCDSAAKYLPARWDSGDSNASDYLNTQDTRRYTSVFAKSLKSRALLYAASPLSQDTKPSTSQGQQQDWEDAALAAQEAITWAETNGWEMLSGDEYTDNFYSKEIVSEHIYALLQRTRDRNVNTWEYGRTYIPYSISLHPTYGHGIGATQDIAERFEAVKYDALGHITNAAAIDDPTDLPSYYHPQDPFNNDVSKGYGRDPRFYSSMIYHGRMIENFNSPRAFDMSEGGIDTKQVAATYDNKTGYYTGKFWNLGVSSNLGNLITNPCPWPIFRTVELFLNYAEAANQAYGPKGGVSGGMSAEEALNVVRSRVNMPDIDITKYSTIEAFQLRVFNERSVELCFESNHAFVDVRRWKMIDKPAYRETYKMQILEDTSNDLNTYPTGYVFTPKLLEIRPYELKHYFFPVYKPDVDKSVLFEQNPGY